MKIPADPVEVAVARRLAAAWGMDPDDDEALRMIAGTTAFHAGVMNEQVRLALGPLAATAERLGQVLVRWQRAMRRLGRTR